MIVQELPGSGERSRERPSPALGGEVVRSLDVIDGFEARLPGDRLAVLRAAAGVKEVTVNATVTLTSTEVDDQAGLNGSLQRITHEMINADDLWNRGYTGKGVDVALIDSGVAPVRASGPARSSTARTCRSRQPEHRCAPSTADTYGHGTHMAGIIAGRDATAAVTDPTASSSSASPPAPASSTSRSPPPTAHRRLAGDRRHRLGRPAPQRQRDEHPRPEPVVRHQRHAELPARPADLRGRDRLAERHRRRRRRRQHGNGTAKLNNPATDPY